MWRREERKGAAQRNIVMVHRFLDRRVLVADEIEQGVDGVVAGTPSIGKAGIAWRRDVLSEANARIGLGQIQTQVVAMNHCDVRQDANVGIAGSESLQSANNVSGKFSACVIDRCGRVVLVLVWKRNERRVHRGICHAIYLHPRSVGIYFPRGFAMSLFAAQSDAINPDNVVLGVPPQHGGRNANRDHVDVVTCKAIASALEFRDVWLSAENRTNEPIEAHDVEEERIISKSGEESSSAS